MTVVKSKEIVFRVPELFCEKKNKQTNKTNKQKKKKKKKKKPFSKYINIKMCSGKTAKLKDLFPTERDSGLNAQLYCEFSNVF